MKWIKKLKVRFVAWLCKEHLEKINNELNKVYIEFGETQDEMKGLIIENKELLNSFYTIFGHLKIGVDVDTFGKEYNESWAVICLRGKKNYVKFINLSGSEIQHIQMFLKNFENKNKTVDKPHGGMWDKYF